MSSRKNTKAQERFSYAQMNKLIEMMGPQTTLSFLQRNFPGNKVALRNAAVVRMSCPLQGGDSTPSFDVDTSSGTIHCFGCGYHTRNLLQFLDDALGWSYQEGAQRVQEQTSVRVFSDKYIARFAHVEIHQLTTKLLFRVFNQHLQNCVLYSNSGAPDDDAHYTPSLLAMVKPTLDWLFIERKHDPFLVHHLPYGMLPPYNVTEDLFVQQIQVHNAKMFSQGRPGIDESTAVKLVARCKELLINVDTSYNHAVTFHNGYATNVPGRIRLRRPRSDAKDVVVLDGFEENAPVGYFGLFDPHASALATELKQLFVLAVEGENDCLSILEGHLNNQRTGMLTIATGGSHGQLDDLLEAGITRLHLLADEPVAGNGAAFIFGRLQTAQEVVVNVFDKWAELRAVEGDPTRERFDVKDPDDVIHKIGYERLYDVAIANHKTSYVGANVWARNQALLSAAEVGTDDIVGKTQLAAKYGAIVRHPALQAEYIRDIASAFNIAPGPIFQEILKKRDTEEAFVLRIAEHLRTTFHSLFKEDDGRFSYLMLWHKEQRRTVRLPLHDGQAAAIQLSNIYGEITAFFRDVIGLPGFLAVPADVEETGTALPIKQHYRDICMYLSVALQHLFKGVPDRRLCNEYAQGVHLIDDPEDITAVPGKAAKVLVVVNGASTYVGRWPDPEKPAVVWSEPPGPRLGNCLFNVGFDAPTEAWSVEIRSIADLEDGNTIDIGPHIERLVALLDSNWCFHHKTVDATFVAYHLFASSVVTVFPTPVMLAILGETSSGKSSLLNLFSGHSAKRLQLLEACRALSSFTMASIYLAWNNSTIGLGLDEFENEGENTHKAQQVANVIEMLRQLITEEGATIDRGTKDGGTTHYSLRSNVFIASINQARKIQDENRRFEIRMDKIQTGFRDAAAGILSDIPIGEYHAIRRAVSVGMMKHALQLHRVSEKIETALLTEQVANFNVPSRFIKNYTQAASVMAILGLDWKAFVRDSCGLRKTQLQALAAETSSQTIYDRVIFTAAVPLPSNRAIKVSLNEMLATPAAWAEINKSGVGFFYIPELKKGIVHWITSQTALLNIWTEYTGIPHRTLKDTFDRHPNALKTETYDTSGVWPHVQRLIPGVRKHDVSIIDLAAFMAEIGVIGPAVAPEAALEVAPVAVVVPEPQPEAVATVIDLPLKKEVDGSNNVP